MKMKQEDKQLIEDAKEAAIEVLLHNAHGPFNDLPRVAGWGYPEPYTRDLMISLLGVLVSENDKLMEVYKKVLETLAQNQTYNGHICSLVHDLKQRGASDCTPLFLMGVGLYRKATGQTKFLNKAVKKSLTWMEYQSPSDKLMVAQLPTTDWRDEKWVMGYGLYVNTIVYCYLRLLGEHEQAEKVKNEIRFSICEENPPGHVHDGLKLCDKPYFALWSFKIYRNERFDLLGNSLAVLTGIATISRAKEMIDWVESECKHLKKIGHLCPDIHLPPNFFPFIQPGDPDWMPRYEIYNKPGHYHNGGIWPFTCGFYVAALVAAGMDKLAKIKLLELAKLNKLFRQHNLKFGFNEWLDAQNCMPMGQDWQSWSAAMFLYAAKCVEENSTPFFDDIRK
jgi:hypothetical protein